MRYNEAPATKKPQSRRSHSLSKRRKSGPTSGPTSEQWRAWKRMQFCAVDDPRNGERLVFHPGDDILVLNHDWRPDRHYDMCDSWVGKIIDIRGNSPRNIWIIVQWYFSGRDIAESIPVEDGNTGVETSCYGRFERSLAQDRQLISTLSINGKAKVVEYDEVSPMQEPIPPACFYTRRAYNSLFGSVTPSIEEGITCICGRPYNPDTKDDPMHFCPRFSCQRWYHAACLITNGYISDKYSDERIREFLDIPQPRVGRIPPDLLQLACVPITKGGPEHGVVGNIKTTCEARNWAQLYAGTPRSERRPGLLLNGITLDRWLDGLDGVEVEELIYPDDESGSEIFSQKKLQKSKVTPPFVCPSCEKPI